MQPFRITFLSNLTIKQNENNAISDLIETKLRNLADGISVADLVNSATESMKQFNGEFEQALLPIVTKHDVAAVNIKDIVVVQSNRAVGYSWTMEANLYSPTYTVINMMELQKQLTFICHQGPGTELREILTKGRKVLYHNPALSPSDQIAVA